MLEIWDEKLAEYAEIIYTYRKEFIKKIEEKILDIHKKITQNNEIIKIEFISDFENKEKYLEKLKKERKQDIVKGYTGRGIHRDDFNIFLNDKAVSVYGSQGQHRTVLLSLKISELNIIYDEIGYNGLINSKKGRPSKNPDMNKKAIKQRELNESELEELIRLRAENEYIKTEIEVLKKSIALRQEKEAARLKAKKQRSSKNLENKDTN